MSSNSTSILIISSHCTLNVLQLQLHAIAVEASFYLQSLLGISYPLVIIDSVLTLVALCTIRGWRSSTRVYYYVIAVANIVAVFSADWNSFLVALKLWCTRWYPKGVEVVIMLHWELLWSPLCALFNFFNGSCLLPKLWAVILLCVHRTWIVLQPLRAPLAKRVFRPSLVIGLPVGLVVLVIPHLFMSAIVNNASCISKLQSNDVSSFWSLYWIIVTLIFKLLLPNPIGTICVILTLWCIVSARAARSALIYNPSAANNFSGNGRPGTGAKGVSKNTQAMLLLGGIYFFISLPNIFLYILISLQAMSCTMTFVALIASDIFPPVSNFTFFTRIFDGLAFLVIPEFRAALINVLHCRFHTKVF